MTKHTLRLKLHEFISNGFLEEQYSDDRFSVFIFLEKAFVAFPHFTEDAEEQKVMGALLKQDEAIIAMASKTFSVAALFSKEEDTNLEFSKELLEKCSTAKGRRRVKRDLRDRLCIYYRGKTELDFCPEEIPLAVGQSTLATLITIRREKVKEHLNRAKKIKILSVIALSCLFLYGLLVIGAIHLSDYGPEVPSVPFDKNSSSDSYSYIDVDMLVPLASIYDKSGIHKDGIIFGQYFLYGNSRDGSFGVLKFSETTDEVTLADSSEGTILDKPVRLYGNTYELHYKMTHLLDVKEEKTEETNPTSSSGHTLELPDGTSIWIPDYSIPTISIPEAPLDNYEFYENSEEAFAFMAKNGITITESSELGARFINAGTKAETQETVIFHLAFAISALSGVTALVLWFVLIILAYKNHIIETFLNNSSFSKAVLDDLMKEYKRIIANKESQATDDKEE